MKWESITRDELSSLIDVETIKLSSEQVAFFESIKTQLQKVSIDRAGNIEEVFIVATHEGKVLFFDDIEEGFEWGILDDNGIIQHKYANQWSLKMAIHNVDVSS